MHGNKRATFRGNRWGGKTAVMGLLERHAHGSTVRAQVVLGVKRHELNQVIDANVERHSTIYTDALHSYRQLADRYQHEFIDHIEGYVRGAVHTNGLESFWSMLKRSLHGTYISVEPFHLSRYVDEQSYRFNTRKHSDAHRFSDVMQRVTGKRLTYRELTGGDRDESIGAL